MYIVFEGIDGSGKTWQSKKLFERLQDHGHDVVWTREPGSNLINYRLSIRDLIVSNDPLEPTALECLLQADRAEHTQAITETLKSKAAVIADRSFFSGLAYGMANGHKIEKLLPLIDFVTDQIPDYVFFMDCKPETAATRMNDGKGPISREELHGLAHMKRIRENYLYLMSGGAYFADNSGFMDEIVQKCTFKRFSVEAAEKGETSDKIFNFVKGVLSGR